MTPTRCRARRPTTRTSDVQIVWPNGGASDCAEWRFGGFATPRCARRQIVSSSSRRWQLHLGVCRLIETYLHPGSACNLSDLVAFRLDRGVTCVPISSGLPHRTDEDPPGLA